MRTQHWNRVYPSIWKFSVSAPNTFFGMWFQRWKIRLQKISNIYSSIEQFLTSNMNQEFSVTHFSTSTQHFSCHVSAQMDHSLRIFRAANLLYQRAGPRRSCSSCSVDRPCWEGPFRHGHYQLLLRHRYRITWENKFSNSTCKRTDHCLQSYGKKFE